MYNLYISRPLCTNCTYHVGSRSSGDRQIENNVAAGARCKADVETLQVTVGGGHVKHLHLREGGQVESGDLPEMSAKRRGIGLAGYCWLTELTFEPWALR